MDVRVWCEARVGFRRSLLHLRQALFQGDIWHCSDRRNFNKGRLCLKIPLLDLKAQHDPIHKELMDAIERVLKSQAFILGSEVKLLEERIASYCRTQFAIGVSS